MSCPIIHDTDLPISLAYSRLTWLVRVLISFKIQTPLRNITEFIIPGSVFDVRSLYRITTTINYCWTMTTVLIGQLSFLFVLPKNIKSIITSLSDYYTASVVHSISSLDLSSPKPTLNASNLGSSEAHREILPLYLDREHVEMSRN